jgi:hypothetical protein
MSKTQEYEQFDIAFRRLKLGKWKGLPKEEYQSHIQDLVNEVNKIRTTKIVRLNDLQKSTIEVILGIVFSNKIKDKHRKQVMTFKENVNKYLELNEGIKWFKDSGKVDKLLVVLRRKKAESDDKKAKQINEVIKKVEAIKGKLIKLENQYTSFPKEEVKAKYEAVKQELKDDVKDAIKKNKWPLVAGGALLAVAMTLLGIMSYNEYNYLTSLNNDVILKNLTDVLSKEDQMKLGMGGFNLEARTPKSVAAEIIGDNVKRSLK